MISWWQMISLVKIERVGNGEMKCECESDDRGMLTTTSNSFLDLPLVYTDIKSVCIPKVSSRSTKHERRDAPNDRLGNE